MLVLWGSFYYVPINLVELLSKFSFSVFFCVFVCISGGWGGGKVGQGLHFTTKCSEGLSSFARRQN